MTLLNITLISSFHKIHGNCNPAELYKIIERLQPYVIFEELSTNCFEIIYSPYYQPETIEAITIKQYLQKYPIKHFPVDNYPIHENDLTPATNSTYKKLAVQCSADTFVVNEALVLRIKFCGENRQLLLAAKRYVQP